VCQADGTYEAGTTSFRSYFASETVAEAMTSAAAWGFGRNLKLGAAESVSGELWYSLPTTTGISGGLLNRDWLDSDKDAQMIPMGSAIVVPPDMALVLQAVTPQLTVSHTFTWVEADI